MQFSIGIYGGSRLEWVVELKRADCFGALFLTTHGSASAKGIQHTFCEDPQRRKSVRYLLEGR